MTTRCPHASRYTMEWSYEGEGPLGAVVPFTTVYDRRTRSLKHYWDIPDADSLWTLTNVNFADIHAVARKTGNFDDLKKHMKQRQRKQQAG